MANMVLFLVVANTQAATISSRCTVMIHIVKELGVPCPDCGNELVLRQGRYGMFVGCSHYPTCHHIESINQPEPEQESKELYACPECGKGHLVLNVRPDLVRHSTRVITIRSASLR